jgi:predicted amidohydrolase
MGLCVCFDIRFPELSRLMALDGAQAIFCPAAFNMTTGPAHWELLFRGRAVENQVFTLGCAPARDEQGAYVSYGNSIAVSPWGDVIARAGAEETILYADLDLGLVETVRRQLPLVSARRTDVYRLEKN